MSWHLILGLGLFAPEERDVYSIKGCVEPRSGGVQCAKAIQIIDSVADETGRKCIRRHQFHMALPRSAISRMVYDYKHAAPLERKTNQSLSVRFFLDGK